MASLALIHRFDCFLDGFSRMRLRLPRECVEDYLSINICSTKTYIIGMLFLSASASNVIMVFIPEETPEETPEESPEQPLEEQPEESPTPSS
jgi:hypothetical protein